jgi:hypothetical protein
MSPVRKNQGFLYVMSCCLYKCFTGTQCLLLWGPAVQDWLTLKMKSLHLFEMLITIDQSTWQHTALPHHLHANISKCDVKRHLNYSLFAFMRCRLVLHSLYSIQKKRIKAFNKYESVTYVKWVNVGASNPTRSKTTFQWKLWTFIMQNQLNNY